MRSRDIVGHHRRHHAAVGVRTHRVGEQCLARGKTALRQTVLFNRLHRHHGRGFGGDRHLARGKRGRRRRLALVAPAACVVRHRHAHLHRLQGRRILAVEVGRAVGRQNHLALAQRKIRRVRSRDIVGHHRRHHAAVGVRTHRVIEQRLTRGKPTLDQSILGNRLHRDHRRSLVRNLNIRCTQRSRRRCLTLGTAVTPVVRDRHGHLHRLQIHGLVTVEVPGTSACQNDLPLAQRKICRMIARHTIADRIRQMAAIGIRTDCVREQCLACGKPAFNQSVLGNRLHRHRANRGRRGRVALIAAITVIIGRRDGDGDRVQIRRIVAVEVSRARSGQFHLALIQREICGVNSSHVIRYRQRLRAAVRVRADRISEQRLAGREATLRQAVFIDRLHRHGGSGFRRDRHFTGGKRGRRRRPALVAPVARVIRGRDGHLHRLQVRCLVIVEIGSARGRQDNLAFAERKIRRMRSRNIVGHHRRHHAAVSVRTHRVIEQRLARGKSSLDQSVLRDGLHRDHRRSLVCNLNFRSTQRSRRRCVALVVAVTCIIRRRHGHLQRLQINRIVTVEIGGTGGRQHDLPLAQRKIRRMLAGHTVRYRIRHLAAVGVQTDRVSKQRLACGKPALDQSTLGNRLDPHRSERGRRGRLAFIAAVTRVICCGDGDGDRIQIRRFVAVQIRCACGRQDNMAIAQREICRMIARDSVRHRQCLHAAIRVRTDRVGEQGLAGGITSFQHPVSGDRLNRHVRSGLARDRHVAGSKRGRGSALALVATVIRIIRRSHGHLHRLQVRRLVAVEVGCSVRGQDDLPIAQRKIRRMIAWHTVGHRQRLRAAIRVCTDRVSK